MAERVGFEPTVRVTVHLISSQAHSASLAPLRAKQAVLSGALLRLRKDQCARKAERDNFEARHNSDQVRAASFLHSEP